METGFMFVYVWIHLTPPTPLIKPWVCVVLINVLFLLVFIPISHSSSARWGFVSLWVPKCERNRMNRAECFPLDSRNFLERLPSSEGSFPFIFTHTEGLFSAFFWFFSFILGAFVWIFRKCCTVASLLKPRHCAWRCGAIIRAPERRKDLSRSIICRENKNLKNSGGSLLTSLGFYKWLNLIKPACLCGGRR